MNENFRLDRLPAVLEQRGDGHSSLYLDIQRGMWTPPVHLGRASAWPHHEAQALVRARIAGATPERLRALVRELLDQRAAMMPDLGGTKAIQRDSASVPQTSPLSLQDDAQPATRTTVERRAPRPTRRRQS